MGDNPPPKLLKPIATSSTVKPIKAAPTNKPWPKPLAKSVRINRITLKPASFEKLPGWDQTDVKKSFNAFLRSCQTFLKQNPKHRVGPRHLNLVAKDWHPACQAALSIDTNYEADTRQFFETWFYPIEFGEKKPINGIFTGYYMPQLKGSLTKTAQYKVPIYGFPNHLSWNTHHKKSDKPKSLSYYTRAKIDNGALKKKAPIIAWIHSPVERLFLEIEGAGVIKLPGGKNIYLGYAGENGAPYTSVGSVLIKKGVMNKHTASKSVITHYLENHPKNTNAILQKNKSFVFFEKEKHPMALGAQDMALTPGYSLAVDKRWIPLGAPLWLDTTIPKKGEPMETFQRLMIAQDTGGAIRGLIRGDIYWGSGKKASYLGENMKNKGRYWLLLPKKAYERLAV